MAGFLTSTTQTAGWKPAAAPSLPSRVLQLPTRAHSTPTPPLATAPAVAEAAKKKKKHRNIACVSCNKQKKRCGDIRPCGRCTELGIICQQPIKPEGYTYFTKKRKLNRVSTVPPSPPLFNDDHHPSPGTLRITSENPQQNHHQLPSPSPSVSTVGTPQNSHTSISSYDDPAQTIPASTGKNGNASEPHLDSQMRPHSVSPDCTSLATPTEETPGPTPIWDVSCWDLPALPAPAEEVPCEIAENSKYAGAPVFGLEKPVYDPNLQDDSTTFGEPIDLGDVSRADDLGMQGTEGAHSVDAGVAASGVALGAENGITWDPDWLDEVDLSTTDLVFDDVDLSNLDFSCLNDDILMGSGMSQLFAQPVLPSSPPQAPPLSPPPLQSGAEPEADIHLSSPGRPGSIG